MCTVGVELMEKVVLDSVSGNYIPSSIHTKKKDMYGRGKAAPPGERENVEQKYEGGRIERGKSEERSQ